MLNGKKGLFILVAVCLSVSVASAGVLVFERDLPVTNINNGPNRSNVGIPPGSISSQPFVVGDDFTLAADATIGTISVYAISNGVAGGATDPSTEFSSITLFYGPDSVGLTGSTSSYTATKVTYTGGLNEQDLYNPDVYHDVYRLDFALNWAVLGSTLYDFAVVGVGNGGNVLGLHATNTFYGGATATDFDNSALLYDAGNPPVLHWMTDAATIDGFPRGADVNVLIYTADTGVPEPSTFALFGLGISAVAFKLRRRKQ